MRKGQTMKIRDRLAFRQAQNGGAIAEGHAEPQVAPVSPVETSESPPVVSEPANGLAGAFDGVARAVGGELESVRGAVSAVESKLTARLEADRRGTDTAIGNLRKDLLHRVEEMRHEQQKTLNEIADKTKEAVASLKALMERTREQLDERSREVRQGLEQILLEKEQKIAGELGVLANELAGVKTDLDGQIRTSGRVTSLLGDLAGVFTGQQEPVRQEPTAKRASADEGKQAN
jgi:hypothetical protein